MFFLPTLAFPLLLAAQAPAPVASFLQSNCVACHNAKVKQGNLDLSSLSFDLENPIYFAKWERVHDRVRDGEMPPIKNSKLTPPVVKAFLNQLAAPLVATSRARMAVEGRSTLRRMNRYEYENTLRDILDAPWLQVKEMLPEDGIAYRYNKVSEALNISHVQMSRYLAASEYALREVLPRTATQPQAQTNRYYTREMPAFFRKVNFPRAAERNTFPVLGEKADLGALRKTAPMTVGAANPELRELEGLGVIASTYEPIEIRFDKFVAPVAGRYKLRFSTHTMWVGPEKGERWWKPDPENISRGRTVEPVVIYSEKRPHQMRRLGSFDAHPDARVVELDVYLLPNESIRPDAVRLFRSRPQNWRNPLATPEGSPGVVFRWMEAEGPIVDKWPGTGHQLLFADLPYTLDKSGKAEFQSKDPQADTQRLLRRFLDRAYRRPVPEEEVLRFARLTAKALASGYTFTDAMISTYSAILCSPAFVTLEEKPGKLDNYALAARLSYFLRNSEPDAELRQLASAGKLGTPATLRAQTERLLRSPDSARFVSSFLDYWLDLRKLDITSPDERLYNDYYLDEYLVESSGDETRAFFAELVGKNLAARNLVDSDFVMVNEKLAKLYGIPGVEGSALRRVPRPAGNPRGGLMTQASILKITANGTTTSPVLRGVWIAERILGLHIPPPPAAVPAVEPDTRGAATIRELLAKHRSDTTCNSCHQKIDPAGFALESFDVAGGYRDKYRALPNYEQQEWTKAPDWSKGIGHNGLAFQFEHKLPVDPSGVLPNGRRFADVRELKQHLLADERQIARNLATQLITYSTGAPVRFGDRPALEAILNQTQKDGYGVRSLIHAIVQSELFCSK
ncbi:MAG: hypothetical protein OHK0021_08590 [Bryobacter sp.]